MRNADQELAWGEANIHIFYEWHIIGPGMTNEPSTVCGRDADLQNPAEAGRKTRSEAMSAERWHQIYSMVLRVKG